MSGPGQLDLDTSETALDATKKLSGEFFKRPWRVLIKIDEAVKAKVDQIFNR